MVVVVGDSPTECVVPCASVVVGAVGALCGEATFEGFSHRFGQERPGDGVSCRESVRAECSHAWRCPVACGKDAQLVIGEAPRHAGLGIEVMASSDNVTRSWSSVGLPDVGAFALVGSGCPVRSRRLARVRTSGVIASLKNEVVASIVIVCPSSQQPCSYSTRVKCGGGTTRR